MILVIPSIDLRHGHCLRCIEGEPGTEKLYNSYSFHPDNLAKLLRRENAKSVHITDHDSFDDDKDANTDMIDAIIRSIDIPVELLRCFDTVEEVEEQLEKGVYRVVLHSLILTDPEGVRSLIKHYTPSRIIAGVRADKDIAVMPSNVHGLTALDYGLQAKALGITRLIYTDISWEGTLCGPDTDILRTIAIKTQMRITAAGGVSSPSHLWALQELQPFGLDSVIVGRALYENKFPCQKIWRQAEARLEVPIED
jgi:phosphoribosylformimino-5-aminoimidazole carboxamide ribotide isomerase